MPYIKVTWEYVAATITSNSDEVTLGSQIAFTITPEVTGETHNMCGRYYIDEKDAAEELRQIIEEVNRKNNGDIHIKASGAIRPTDIVPVVVNSRKEEWMAFAMKWGYSLPDGKPVFNAKSETAATSVMFRDGMERRRCLVPATNYFVEQTHPQNIL